MFNAVAWNIVGIDVDKGGREGVGCVKDDETEGETNAMELYEKGRVVRW